MDDKVTSLTSLPDATTGGRKRRPTGRHDGLPDWAYSGVSGAQPQCAMVSLFGFHDQPPLPRQRATRISAGVMSPHATRVVRGGGWSWHRNQTL